MFRLSIVKVTFHPCAIFLYLEISPIRLKRIVIFDIRIFGRFLNGYPNILVRPYCLKMTDEVTYIKWVWITFTAFFHCTELNLKRAQQKLKIHNKMGTAIKSVTFVFTKNVQNCSKWIIGQKIDIWISPKWILIQDIPIFIWALFPMYSMFHV